MPAQDVLQGLDHRTRSTAPNNKHLRKKFAENSSCARVHVLVERVPSYDAEHTHLVNVSEAGCDEGLMEENLMARPLVLLIEGCKLIVEVLQPTVAADLGAADELLRVPAESSTG